MLTRCVYRSMKNEIIFLQADRNAIVIRKMLYNQCIPYANFTKMAMHRCRSFNNVNNANAT
jgi:hypothetical protein